MEKADFKELSKRERQIMDIIYQHKEANAQLVMEKLPDPPSYSAVRALLKILEQKGFLSHKKDGLKYIYQPTIQPKKAMESALKKLLTTYFNNSTQDAVCALLDMNKNSIKKEDYDRILEIIKKENKG
jgi:BlaI family transcriptional regulator, penicillinase repressor